MCRSISINWKFHLKSLSALFSYSLGDSIYLKSFSISDSLSASLSPFYKSLLILLSHSEVFLSLTFSISHLFCLSLSLSLSVYAKLSHFYFTCLCLTWLSFMYVYLCHSLSLTLSISNTSFNSTLVNNLSLSPFHFLSHYLPLSLSQPISPFSMRKMWRQLSWPLHTTWARDWAQSNFFLSRFVFNLVDSILRRFKIYATGIEKNCDVTLFLVIAKVEKRNLK